MKKLLHTIAPAFLLLGGSLAFFSGCRSDGNTTRIDYTYQKPVWTDTSFEHDAKPKE